MARNGLSGWAKCEFGDLLDYIQPTEYIVKSTEYDDDYKTPVLTPGKSFIKGYTDETIGIFKDLPAIIFDDFTTASRLVNFPFKVKSSAMKILVPKSDEVNLNFAFYAMQVNKVRNDTHKRYWISVFAIQKFFLPPLNEQHRIVSKIEELFTELDAAVEALKALQKQVKQYRQSVLKSAFDGKLTEKWREKNADKLEPIKTNQNRVKIIKEEIDAQKALEANIKKIPVSWRTAKIGDVFDVYVGATPSRKKETYWDGDINWISSGEVAFKRINTTKETISEEGLNNSSTNLHPKGTVLLGMIGEGKTRGQAAILDINACNSQNSAAIRVSEQGMQAEYLYYYFHLNYQNIRGIGSGNNQKALNKSRVQNLIAPFASISEQSIIVQEIERYFSIAEQAEKTIEQSLKKAEYLRQSILNRAFEGKLVPQDPNDEPASDLLARIKADKEKIQQEMKTRKKVK